MDKTKTIETEELKIKGNIMCWSDTILQLSNISCISTAKLIPKPFPVWSLLLLFIGIILLEDNPIIGICLLIAGGIWIFLWYQKNLDLEKLTCLNILMNSGTTLRIIVTNKKFLNQILDVLEKIIIDGGVGNQQISINIEDCEISGNAHILDHLNIKSNI